PPIYGWPHGPAPPPPSPRIRPPARREGCGPRCRDCQAGHVPHLPSLVCHPPARGESRHPDRPGAARPPGCQHHDDLHACAQPGTCRSPESRRPDVPVMTAEGRETRSEEHTSELQSRFDLVCRLLLEKKKNVRCKLALL